MPCILDKYAVAGTLVWSNTCCSRVRLFNTIQYNSIQCVHVRSSVHPSVYNTKEYNTIQCVHVRSSDRPSVRSYLNSVKPCHGTFLWTFAGTSIITIIQSSINKEYNTIQYNASTSVHPFVRPCDRIILPLSPVTVPFFALYIHELGCVAFNSSGVSTNAPVFILIVNLC